MPLVIEYPVTPLAQAAPGGVKLTEEQPSGAPEQSYMLILKEG